MSTARKMMRYAIPYKHTCHDEAFLNNAMLLSFLFILTSGCRWAGAEKVSLSSSEEKRPAFLDTRYDWTHFDFKNNPREKTQKKLRGIIRADAGCSVVGDLFDSNFGESRFISQGKRVYFGVTKHMHTANFLFSALWGYFDVGWNESGIRKQLRQFGFNEVRFLSDPKNSEINGFVAWKSGPNPYVIIHFRGTNGPKSALADAMVRLKDATNLETSMKGRVHSGFAKAILAMKTQIDRATKEARSSLGEHVPVLLTGHKLRRGACYPYGNLFAPKRL